MENQTIKIYNSTFEVFKSILHKTANVVLNDEEAVVFMMRYWR